MAILNLLNQLKKIKIPQQAQRLLDYFVKRLAESNIRNPIAYFTALKNRLLKGQLDLPEEGGVVEEKKKIDTELNELRSEYQEAFSDREQLKKHIQLTMNSEKCTFDKAIRKICYHELWKTACKRLDKIIKKLKIYHQAVRKFRESTLSCWPNTVGNLMRDIFGYSVVFQMNNFKNNAG